MSFCSKVCTIEMKSSIDTMVLLPKRLDVIQERDMNLFRVTDYSLTFANEEDEKQGIRMSLVMKRKITSEMMTTYFPSLLLTLITFATTFFKPFFFEAALSVNLTTMLVMTTIFISKMEGLPPTSDTKMIDYWLILCQLVPFAQVVLLTAMEYIREEQDENQASENKEIQWPVPNQDEQKDKPDGEGEPKEAWISTQIKQSKIMHLTILTTIGKILIRFVAF